MIRVGKYRLWRVGVRARDLVTKLIFAFSVALLPFEGEVKHMPHVWLAYVARMVDICRTYG